MDDGGVGVPLDDGFLGIIFVCHSTQRGDQLVFRYPEVVRNSVTQETLRAYTTRFHVPSEAGPGGGGGGGGGAGGGAGGGRPRTAMPPTRSQTQPAIIGASSGVRRTLSTVGGNRKEDGGNDPPIVNRLQWDGTPYNMSSVILAPFVSPKRSLAGHYFELSIDNTRFIGYPVLLNDPDKKAPKVNVLKLSALRHSSQRRNSVGEVEAGAVQDELTTFNIIFVITEEEAHKDNGRRYQMYREAVLQLVNALKHEQFRCGYLSSEVQSMLAVRERWLWKISNCKEGEKPPDHQQLTDDILNTSALAHELREIYHSLSDHGQARLCLNRWVDLHLSLDDSLKHPTFPIRPYHTLLLLGSRHAILDSLPQDSSPTLKLFINALHSTPQPPKSFQEINWDTNIPLPHIFRMVAHLIYWKKGKLIKSLSQHSVFIINPRMKEKKSDLYSNYLLSLDQSFSHSFFNFRLAEILRDFSTPLTLVTHVHKLAANKQKDFLNVVVWLLRHDLIIELNTYFYLNIPLEVEINVREKEREREREKERIERSKKRLALPENGSIPKTPLISNVVVLDDEEESTSASNTGKASVDGGSHRASNGFVKSKPSSSAAEAETYPSAPQPLQPHEAAYLDRLNDGGMIYKLFLRLCPLFRGHHHAEEILWRMGITRDDLQKVLDKYHDLVVPCMHEASEGGLV